MGFCIAANPGATCAKVAVQFNVTAIRTADMNIAIRSISFALVKFIFFS
jgi:hypothetical protein